MVSEDKSKLITAKHRLPVDVKEGDTYVVERMDPKEARIIKIHYTVDKIEENETTDKTPGAVIIKAKRRVIS